jgi:hypothetical protein
MYPFLILIFTFLLGSSNGRPETVKPALDKELKKDTRTKAEGKSDTIKRKPYNFSPVLSFPLIQDTADSIRQLKAFGKF